MIKIAEKIVKILKDTKNFLNILLNNKISTNSGIDLKYYTKI